jgi:hypothetical protein
VDSEGNRLRCFVALLFRMRGLVCGTMELAEHERNAPKLSGFVRGARDGQEDNDSANQNTNNCYHGSSTELDIQRFDYR